LLVPFILGLLIILFNLVVRFDLLMKEEDNESKKYLFIFLFMAIPFVYQSMFYNHVEDRYLMNAFPAFFIAVSIGLMGIKDFVNKYSKPLSVLVVIAFLLGGAYYQINLANTSIKAKVTSYQEVKEVGILIKENSNISAVVMTMSLPQISYYAERETIVIPENQSDFETQIKKDKPTFLIVSIFERHPTWVYTYVQAHSELFTPIQIYYQTVNGQQQPVLILYKFI
jgi:4-amino-4-deoxy-L-arabinose transferase-like glycosyltransferase